MTMIRDRIGGNDEGRSHQGSKGTMPESICFVIDEKPVRPEPIPPAESVIMVRPSERGWSGGG